MLRSKLISIMLASLAAVLAVALISFPEEALKASVKGLNTWWKIVFPSLLPFFIVAEIMIGFGVVKFIGVLLEPLMRPIFRVPGVGGFVWAMGMASGNPAGAKLTVRMRQDEAITQAEGERLVAFTSCANPLFIFGAVAVGFFHNANLGIILGISHYIGNVFVGLVMRFYGATREQREERSPFSIKTAFQALHTTRIKDKRPIGKLLGDAVINSIQTLLMIGGFIILFSVINQLLSIMQVTDIIAVSVKLIFLIFTLSTELSLPFISGLFEMTIGSQLISETNNIPLLQQAIVVSFLLAFGGFSIQAQVASILAQSDIRFLPFLLARLLHGFFAAFITLIVWKPIYIDLLSAGKETIAVFHLFTQETSFKILEIFATIGPAMTIISLMLYIIIYTKRTFLIK